MPKFIVTVYKTEVFSTDIEIEASTLDEAESMAVDSAQRASLHWSYEESDFTCYGYLIEGEEKLWTNHYKCDCGCEWQDTWGSQCEDRCPKCDTSCSPHESEEAPQ